MAMYNGGTQLLGLSKNNKGKKLSFFVDLKRQKNFFIIPMLYFFRYFQYLTGYFPIKYILSPFLNLRIEGENNIKDLKAEKVLFIANHLSRWDPFIIGAATPRSHFENSYCMRFMTHYKHIRSFKFGPLIWMAGAYSIFPNNGKDYGQTLKKTINILNSKQTVLMFPVGRINEALDPAQARPGVAYVAKTADPVIVPVLINGSYSMSLSELLKKRHVTVKFGQPFRHKDVAPDNVDIPELAKLIMRRVTDLK